MSELFLRCGVLTRDLGGCVKMVGSAGFGREGGYTNFNSEG